MRAPLVDKRPQRCRRRGDLTATALLLARSRARPPAYVLYLGAFYVLTPGSRGLRGFETWLGGHPIMGFKSLGDMVALFTALAVGMLVAAAAVFSSQRRP